MNFISKNSVFIAIIGVFFIIIFNHSVVSFGVNRDVFGILFSVILFLIGGRKTNFKVSYLILPMILFFEFVSYRLHTKSLHFLSLVLFICLIYNYFTHKFSFISFVCILLFSTLFDKLFEHLSSEIKQNLCFFAFVTLKNVIHIEKIEGVNFFINHSKVSIDTACMGLSMLKTGLLAAALLLTIEEKKQQKYYSVFQITLFCITAIFLNIVANYFRIIVLILFNCTQENLLHSSIGMLCFFIYQVLPMLVLVGYFKPKKTILAIGNSKNNLLPILILFAIIFATSIEIKNEKNDDILLNLSPKYDVKNGKWVTHEVFKINTDNKLIYIKTPSHKPLICWTGAGYKITESKEIVVENEKIWFNSMEKDNKKYISIWWYECGNKKYTSFLKVMLMKLIYNQPVRLINKTSLEKPVWKP
jgi:exosortase N